MEKVGNEIILKSFSEFVIGTKLLDTESLNGILSDEIITIYIINTINQFFEQYDNEQKWLDSNSLEEAFEIENFIEIIDAYLSGFSQLNQSDIIKWLTQLKQLLNNTLEASSKTEIIETKNEIVEKESTPKNEPVINCNENVISLNEIFPTLSLKDINTIYKKTNQNYEKTIDELLIIQNASVVDSSDEEETTTELNDEDRRLLKERTVKQFGFVAVKEIDNEHTKINVPKWDSNKKLVRYFESKVVTTKGEKYFEPRTEEDEELAKQMKKTYVNLKPARKYRFH